METANLINSIKKNPHKPSVELLFETEFSKEIRIFLAKGQEMKDHKAPFAIVVELFDGKIDFSVEGAVHKLVKGDMLSLAANIVHNLVAEEDSIVRLTLHKGDKMDRVEDVASK